MKLISLSLLACVLLISPSLAQDAPNTQSGNFLYFMPTGWNPVEKDGTTVINAPSPPPGTATFIALVAHDLEGDLQASFNELWGGLRRSYRILQGGQITPLRFKNEFDAYHTSAIVADQGGRRWTVYVMGVQYRKRLQVVTFMSSLPPGSYLSACQDIFRKFLANLTFGDASQARMSRLLMHRRLPTRRTLCRQGRSRESTWALRSAAPMPAHAGCTSIPMAGSSKTSLKKA